MVDQLAAYWRASSFLYEEKPVDGGKEEEEGTFGKASVLWHEDTEQLTETDHSRWSTEPGGGRWATPEC